MSFPVSSQDLGWGCPICHLFPYVILLFCVSVLLPTSNKYTSHNCAESTLVVTNQLHHFSKQYTSEQSHCRLLGWDFTVAHLHCPLYWVWYHLGDTSLRLRGYFWRGLTDEERPTLSMGNYHLGFTSGLNKNGQKRKGTEHQHLLLLFPPYRHNMTRHIFLQPSGLAHCVGLRPETVCQDKLSLPQAVFITHFVPAARTVTNTHFRVWIVRRQN